MVSVNFQLSAGVDINRDSRADDSADPIVPKRMTKLEKNERNTITATSDQVVRILLSLTKNKAK